MRTALLVLLCLSLIGVAPDVGVARGAGCQPAVVQAGWQPAPLAQTDPGQAVESGRKALGNWSGYPWYDAESDGVRRVDVVPPSEPKEREPRDRPTFPTGLDAILQWMAWTAVGLVLALILFLLVRAYLDRQPAPHADGGATEAGDADRVEALPFPVHSGRGNLLDEARRHWQEGNYAQAIVYLFSFQLVHLDKQQVIRLNKGKTNRQYLREIGPRGGAEKTGTGSEPAWATLGYAASGEVPVPVFSAPPRGRLQGLVEHTMLVFEDVFFGNRTLDRARFETCWSRLDEFQALAAGGK
jgi:hypothetical protein